jgi:hypothetical protein
MTRNHFSKAGGPYFINDGLSGHSENQDQSNIEMPYALMLGFVTLLVIGSLVAIAI